MKQTYVGLYLYCSLGTPFYPKQLYVISVKKNDMPRSCRWDRRHSVNINNIHNLGNIKLLKPSLPTVVGNATGANLLFTDIFSDGRPIIRPVARVALGVIDTVLGTEIKSVTPEIMC